MTKRENRWGVQARFAAGVTGLDAPAAARNAAAALDAVNAFMKAWNSHDPKTLAGTLHYPQVRMGDGLVEIWKTADEFLAGPEPGRQRTWYQTRLDQSKAVQVTANGVNVTVSFSRLGRDGRVLSTPPSGYSPFDRRRGPKPSRFDRCSTPTKWRSPFPFERSC